MGQINLYDYTDSLLNKIEFDLNKIKYSVPIFRDLKNFYSDYKSQNTSTIKTQQSSFSDLLLFANQIIKTEHDFYIKFNENIKDYIESDVSYEVRQIYKKLNQQLVSINDEISKHKSKKISFYFNSIFSNKLSILDSLKKDIEIKIDHVFKIERKLLEHINNIENNLMKPYPILDELKLKESADMARFNNNILDLIKQYPVFMNLPFRESNIPKLSDQIDNEIKFIKNKINEYRKSLELSNYNLIDLQISSLNKLLQLPLKAINNLTLGVFEKVKKNINAPSNVLIGVFTLAIISGTNMVKLPDSITNDVAYKAITYFYNGISNPDKVVYNLVTNPEGVDWTAQFVKNNSSEYLRNIKQSTEIYPDIISPPLPDISIKSNLNLLKNNFERS